MNRSNTLLALVSVGFSQLLLASVPTTAFWVHGEANDETVVLIHGFNSSHDTWAKVATELAKRYRVVVYDQPGHGLSPAEGPDNSPRKMAERLKTLLDHLDIEEAHIVGHSMGGRTAVQFAALYPEGVSSLVVEDMNLLSFPDALKQLPALLVKYEKVKAAIPDTFPSQAHAIQALSAFYTPTEILYILAAAVINADGTLRLGNRPEVTNLYLAQGLALDMTEALSEVKAPTAFFAGDPGISSTVLKGEGIDHIKATKGDALVKVFPGSGHSVHDRPEFVKALTEFIAPL